VISGVALPQVYLIEFKATKSRLLSGGCDMSNGDEGMAVAK